MEIKQHIEYSKVRLNVLKDHISKIDELSKNSLCIYTTGSYGRHEASENSDLDLFFLDAEEEKPTSNIDKMLINAEVIKICRAMKLPEFSKDGGYLTIHNIGDILANLGSPTDDFKNYFTARMLLLLESKPIYNERLHSNCIRKIIERYFFDFHDHSKNFKAIFLANDIIRFWKTLCLNYEHGRHRKVIEGNSDSVKNKIVAHSKNLKLKFSRKLTCFSFIIQLADFKGSITQDDLLNMCMLTPVERLMAVKQNNSQIADKVQNALNTYQWFIDRTQIPSEELLSWISDAKARHEAFDKSKQFADELFYILESVDKQNLLSKLLI
jgi:predicted nucleotidyltransferase